MSATGVTGELGWCLPSNIARLKIWHVEHIFSIKRIRLLLDVRSVQWLLKSVDFNISIFFYQGNDSILWRSAVITTVSPGHVHSCMHLVSEIHLKVWMPIVPTCDWWQVASAGNSIPKSAAQAITGLQSLLLQHKQAIRGTKRYISKEVTWDGLKNHWQIKERLLSRMTEHARF